MKRYVLIILSVFTFLSCNTEKTNQEQIVNAVATKIVFGSCSDQKRPQQMWDQMAKEQADYTLILGDIVYADKMPFNEMTAAYNVHKNMESYRSLKASTKIYGVWDDHDFGANDAGKNHVGKDSAQVALFNFLDIPKDDPIRSQKGAYQSYDLKTGAKNVRLILLDTRYFRDTLEADTVTSARYLPNETGDILGQKQWKWLEDQLANSSADIHLIASSIQVLSEEHDFEKWANFPAAKKRLFDLFQSTKASNIVLLSGDRHISEVSKIELPDYPTPIFDLTASGLTHTWSQIWEESNKYRVSDLVVNKNYGVLSIDWEGDNPLINLEFKGHQDSTFLKMPLEL